MGNYIETPVNWSEKSLDPGWILGLKSNLSTVFMTVRWILIFVFKTQRLKRNIYINPFRARQSSNLKEIRGKKRFGPETCRIKQIKILSTNSTILLTMPAAMPWKVSRAVRTCWVRTGDEGISATSGLKSIFTVLSLIGPNTWTRWIVRWDRVNVITASLQSF